MAPRTRGKRRTYTALEEEYDSDTISNAGLTSPAVAAGSPLAEAVGGRARGRNGKFAKASVNGDGPAATGRAKPQAAHRILKGYAARKSARPARKGAGKVNRMRTATGLSRHSSDVMDVARMRGEETPDDHVDEDAYEAFSSSVLRLSQAKPLAQDGRRELGWDTREPEDVERETTGSSVIAAGPRQQLPHGMDAPEGVVGARLDDVESCEDLISQTIDEVLGTAKLERVGLFERVLDRNGLLVEDETPQATFGRLEATEDEPAAQGDLRLSEAQAGDRRTVEPKIVAQNEFVLDEHAIYNAQASTSSQSEGSNRLIQPPASGKPDQYELPEPDGTATRTAKRAWKQSQERKPKPSFFHPEYVQPKDAEVTVYTDEHERKRPRRAEPPSPIPRNASPQYMERKPPPKSTLAFSVRDTAIDRLDDVSLGEDVIAGKVEEVYAARRVHVAMRSKTLEKMYTLMASTQWTGLGKHWESSLCAKYSTDKPEGDGKLSSHDAQARTTAVMILWRELVAFNDIHENDVERLVNQRSGSSGPTMSSLNKQLDDLSKHQHTLYQRSRQIKRRIDLICDKELALINEESLLHRQDLPTRRILVEEIGRLIIPLLVSLLHHAFWLGNVDNTSSSAYFTTSTLKILARIESWLAKLYRTYDGELKARHTKILSQGPDPGQRDATEGSKQQSDSRQAASEGKQPSKAANRKKPVLRDDRGMLGGLLREFEMSLQAAIQEAEAEVNVFKEAQKRRMREVELAEDKEWRARKSNARFAKLVLDSNNLRQMHDPQVELFANTIQHRTSSNGVIEEDVFALPQVGTGSSQSFREESAMPSWAPPVHATNTSARSAPQYNAPVHIQPAPLGQRPSSRPSASSDVQRFEESASAGVDSDGHFDGDGDGAEEYYSVSEDTHDRTGSFPAKESEPFPSIEEASDDSETPDGFQPWTVDMQRRFLEELRKAQNPEEVEQATRSIATAFSRPWGDTVEQRRMLQISYRDLCRRRGLDVEPWARKTKPQL
jgi:hypothetical protein